MKYIKFLLFSLTAVLLFGCYPNIKSYDPIITKSDGQIDKFDEGNYIDNLKRTVNIVYSKSSSRYYVSTDDGLFDAFYTKKIVGSYYLLQGITDKKKPVNLYLVKLEPNKIIIYQFTIPKEKLNLLQKKFNVAVEFNKDEVFIHGDNYNILKFMKYCIKNNYITTNFFLNKKLVNL